MATTAGAHPRSPLGDQEQIPVENPATGAIVGHVPSMTARQVAGLAERGRSVQPEWEALGYKGRGSCATRRARGWGPQPPPVRPLVDPF
jgi:acyl-CoA reductase-like NAD-dependent aldehyde dehydrogenase